MASFFRGQQSLVVQSVSKTPPADDKSAAPSASSLVASPVVRVDTTKLKPGHFDVVNPDDAPVVVSRNDYGPCRFLRDANGVFAVELREDRKCTKRLVERKVYLVHSRFAPPRKVGVKSAKSQLGKKRRVKKGRNMLPPQINATPRLRQTFRFYVNASFGQRAITLKGIFGALGGICSVVNSTIRAWTTSFKIVSLDLYLPSGGQGEISWVVDNTDQGPDQSWDSEIPTGVTVPDRISTSPPAASIASDWVNDTADLTDELFRVTNSTSGAVFDMDVEYTLPNEFSLTSFTVATATLGAAYYLALDDDGGTQNFLPINRPTTT